MTGSNDNRYDELMEGALSGRLNRREVMRRAVLLGLSVPAIGTLLAACGDDDDEGDDDAPTSTTGSGQPAGTPTEAMADATETMAGEEASPTEAGAEMSIDNPPDVPNAEEASAFTGASLTYYGDGVGIGNELDLALSAKFTEATGITVEVIP
ncbi:MAG: ABC transporter substrate-binding protein, partial [Vicinamibacterales bacterium]